MNQHYDELNNDPICWVNQSNTCSVLFTQPLGENYPDLVVFNTVFLPVHAVRSIILPFKPQDLFPIKEISSLLSSQI